MEFIPAPQRDVAREAQIRLYREIGVAAVAEALGIVPEADAPVVEAAAFLPMPVQAEAA